MLIEIFVITKFSLVVTINLIGWHNGIKNTEVFQSSVCDQRIGTRA